MATGTVDRMVVLDVVGLQPGHLDPERTPTLCSLFGDGFVADLRPPFPAVTVPAQTTLATGRSPRTHGDVANGQFDRESDEAEFWGRDRADRTRLWEAASDAGLTTGALFFQHLKGTTADVAITPSPIEDEDNNLEELNCWTNPDGFYDELRQEYDHFPLHNYWGPWAGAESSEWILAAAGETVRRFDPDLLWVYVPHLDYVSQRTGPDTEAMFEELATVDDLLETFLSGLRETPRWDETAVNVVSEYGFNAVDRPVFPNRALWDAGLLVTDATGDVDLSSSEAFAMIDHQVAHVYADDGAVTEARETISALDGVEAVLAEEGKRDRGIDHPSAGEFVLVADRDTWFQYYWWTNDDPPPYATDMDIHAKPGFDPCELFEGEEGLVSMDPTKIGGSHGRVDESTYGCYALGGPAAPTGSTEGVVDARAVAPTVADLLGIDDELEMTFEQPSLLDEDRP